MSVSLLRPVASRFDVIGLAPEFQSAASIAGDVYIAGAAALFRYSEGRLEQTWYVGRELPATHLVALAVRNGIGNPELWIATDSAGIVTFDGHVFRQLLPQELSARRISTMLPLANGHVLVATPKSGLYVTDGVSFQPFHPLFAKTEVTALAGNEDEIWIGTRGDGAWRWRGGEAIHITAELPDQQVLSLATQGERAWIGTPLGVAEFTSGKLSRRLADGLFAHALAEDHGKLWVGTVDQGTFGIPLEVERPRPQLSALAGEKNSAVSFAHLGDALAAVGPGDLAILPSGEKIVTASPDHLAANHVTAVHEDSRARLWVGSFDHGIDVLSQGFAASSQHFEDDTLFCINRIKENSQDGTVLTATANGLAIFDASAKLRQVLNSENGLIASNVTDLLIQPDDGGTSMIIGTPAGLSFSRDGSLSSIYAFHGLVNNHVYTLADLGGTVYAGTLGGLSSLRSGLVQASFNTGNSQLRQNWITASAVFGKHLYLGTYGSGVVRFDDGNTVESYPAFAGHRVEINLNAMLATNRALYAGTAGQGLAILRTGDRRWRYVSEGLPSLNVTALDEHDGRLYVGTDNGLVRIAENNLLP